MAIDNRIEKIREIANEQESDFLGTLASVGGLFSPVLTVWTIANSVVDGAQRAHRAKTSINALCDELESIRSQWPADCEGALNKDWFRKAVRVLLEEASKAINDEDAMKLGRAMAHGCFPNDENKHRQEDLATYISDVSKLGSDDIQMLRLLGDVNAKTIKATPNMHDPEYFRKNFVDFKRRVSEMNIHPDDCTSVCARLSGFGLAYEVPRGPSTGQQATGEHCFRPTRRGMYLLMLLCAAEQPKGTQN